MLKSWQVGHFKSIIKTRDLALADVTVLTGLNHSGKSNLLQSILLISQSLNSHSTDSTLLPDGSFIQFSALNEIVSDNSDHRLTFGFELLLAQTKTAALSPIARPFRRFHTDTSPERSVKVTVDFNFVRPHGGMSLSNLDHTRVALRPSEGGYINIRPSNSGSPAIESLKITLSASNAVNEEIVFDIREIAEEEMSSTQTLARTHSNSMQYVHEGTLSINGQQAPYAYQMLFWHFLPGQLTAKKEVGKSSKRHSLDPALPYVEQIEDTVDRIIHFFSDRVRYLGARRISPASVQRSGHGPKRALDDVGPQGEFAAAVYCRYVQRAILISWYNPLSQDIESNTLDRAVNCWLQYLEVAYSVKCREIGQDSFSWQVVYQEGQQPHSLTGHSLTVNQVLPLLMMGLLAPEDSLLLFEHPELFLHQRAQARLGDFFVGLAACHKQCLIETQSENLVTQLRYHIVHDGGHDPDKYMIYFVEQDEEGDSQFTSVKISPRGNILNWPVGFFDETSLQEEKISIAYLRRKAKSGKQEQPR